MWILSYQKGLFSYFVTGKTLLSFKRFREFFGNVLHVHIQYLSLNNFGSSRLCEMGQLGIFIHFLYFSVAGAQMDPDVPIILNFFSFIHFELFQTYFVKVFFLLLCKNLLSYS